MPHAFDGHSFSRLLVDAEGLAASAIDNERQLTELVGLIERTAPGCANGATGSEWVEAIRRTCVAAREQREAAQGMSARGVGAAVVLDPEAPGPGIVTERDILNAVGNGLDIDEAKVADHLTSGIVYASPDWSLERAAGVMVERGFRHLVVVEGGEIAGVLSVRDIVRMWTKEGAHCEVPAGASAA